jgi:hypothetical protein
MLSLCPGIGLYGLSPYHRLQADALLHGHLFLGDSINQLGPSLAWHDGHVQQVWGLGIGMWLLPFQAAWRLCGGQMFPDRIALGAAFLLLALYTGSTGLRIARNGHLALGLGFIWLVLLCPPLWTLARASQLVFEETVLYGILVSLGMLVALARMTVFNSRTDYFLTSLLAALSGLVRPTLAIYGLSAVLVASLILYGRTRTFGRILLLNSPFAAGLVFLAVTNWIRFGSPMEFGHRLTVNSDSMVYLTRFGNPYSSTPAMRAAEELNGLLFLDSNVRDAGAYSEDLFPGQAATTRWRRLCLTLFDSSYAMVGLVATGSSVWWFARRIKGTNALMKLPQNPRDMLILVLFLWSVISIGGLAMFYLRAPVIASRYLLDFLPGIAGLLTLAWCFAASRFPRSSLVVLAGWLFVELAAAKVPVWQETASQPPVAALPRVVGAPLASFGGNYSLDRPPGQNGIAFNGHGWDPNGGFAGDIVTLVLDNPQFVQLHVSTRREFNGVLARKDVYQAKMNGKALLLHEVTNEEDGLKIAFDVPSQMQTGEQIVFLCFSSSYDAEDRDSERFLYSVRWR